MTRRFIIVDQSIKKPGGHHYEYAQRILDAARAEGYETMLLVHQDYSGTVDHEVRPAFSWTFWDNYRYYYLAAQGPRPHFIQLGLSKLRGKIDAIRRGVKRRLIFSTFGLALARARNLNMRVILLRPFLPDDASSVKTNRSLLVLARLVIRGSHAWQPTKSIIARLRIARFMRLVFLIMFSPLLAVAFGVVLAGAWRGDPAARYVRELMQALKGEKNFSETIFFIPNATAAELEGLLLLNRARHGSASGHWAFLYRRPVFSGYPESYKNQMEAARRHRVELARLKNGAPDVHVHFYTDTDELTAQYNLLGVYAFATLPVPVEPRDNRSAHAKETLVMGYLGDARDEKGFQHLSNLVDHHAPRHGKEPTVRFLFQANFNVPGGEQASRYARSALEGYDKDFVELAIGPFDSAEYDGLLSRMDIVLIPYSAENYSARSSGVLMEALSAGLPVLAPSASWMAGLIEQTRRDHLLELFHGKRDGVRLIAKVTRPYEKINDKVILTDTRANHILVKLKFEEKFNGYVRFALGSINEFDLTSSIETQSFKAIDGEVVAAFAKPRSSKLWWKAEPIEAEVQERCTEVEMSLFEASEPLPLFSGVVLFDRPEDIPKLSMELVTFFSHHKKAAERLRVELRHLYDPAQLVKKLGQDALCVRVSEKKAKVQSHED